MFSRLEGVEEEFKNVLETFSQYGSRNNRTVYGGKAVFCASKTNEKQNSLRLFLRSRIHYSVP